MTPYNEAVETTSARISLLLLLAMVALIVGFAQRGEFALPTPTTTASGQAERIDPQQYPVEHARQARIDQLTQRFDQAVAMLHAREYDFAVTALHRVLELAPDMPEAHVNMGYALLGLEKYKAAGDFFASAINLRPYQGNAYWGLAVALEKLGDKEAALGAMRSYIHLAPPNDQYVKRARAALWEWETELKRGPLPEPEREWLERRGKEWDDRNRHVVDMPSQDAEGIDLLAPR
jgi:tetratricopeptide (TPR) repeat protein